MAQKKKPTVKKTEAQILQEKKDAKIKRFEQEWKNNILDSIDNQDLDFLEYNLFVKKVNKLIAEPLNPKEGFDLPAIFELIKRKDGVGRKSPQFDYLLENYKFLLNSHIDYNLKGENLGLNPFQYAVLLNKWAFAKKIYNANKSIINSVDIKNQNSTLNIVAYNGDKEGVLFLLENNELDTNAKVDTKNAKERTALLLAYGEKLKFREQGNHKEAQKYQDIVDILLKHGASPISDDVNGNFVLSLATKHDPDLSRQLTKSLKTEDLEHANGKGRHIVHDLVLSNDSKQLERMTQRFNSSDSNGINQGDKEGKTPLHLATEQDSNKNLGILLDNTSPDKIKLDEPDNNGNTVPMVTALKGDHHKLSLLLHGNTGTGVTTQKYKETLKNGINYPNRDGENTITTAVRTEDIKSLQLTLSGGADVNSVMGKSKETILNYAINHCNKNKNFNKTGHKCNYKVANILLENGADVNKRSPPKNLTPLLDAVENHNVEGVKLLLKYNADTKLADREGRTPLNIAVHRFSHHQRDPEYKADYKSIIHLLMKEEDLSDSINIKDNNGNTPLYNLIKNTKKPEDVKKPKDLEHSIDLSKKLLNKGSHVTIKNNDQKRAVDLAKNHALKRVIEDHISKGVKEPKGFFDTESSIDTQSEGEPIKDTSKIFSQRPEDGKCKKVKVLYKCENGNGNGINNNRSFTESSSYDYNPDSYDNSYPFKTSYYGDQPFDDELDNEEQYYTNSNLNNYDQPIYYQPDSGY